MGMDAWIMAKTKCRDHTDITGVCGGLLGIIPTTISGDIELGYIRKGYDQNNLISDISLGTFDECYNLYLSKEDCENILEETQKILKEHVFDEEGYDISIDYSYNDSTFMSKQKYEVLQKAMIKALEILSLDKDANIYYHIWC